MKPMKLLKQNLLRLFVSILALQSFSITRIFAVESEVGEGNVNAEEIVDSDSDVAEESTQEETTETEVPGDELTSREEAIQYIEANNLVVQTRGDLIDAGLVNEGQLNALPGTAIYDTLVAYIMANGEQVDVNAFFGLLTSSYPDYFQEAPTTMTEEEALAYIEENNLLETAPALLVEYGLVTQEQLDQLPEGAIQQALVQQFTTVPTLGDIGVLYQILAEIYPEIFGGNNLSEEIVNNTHQYPSLEFNQEVQLGERTYEIRRSFVLRPGEAGNQSEDTMLLGIEYSYENDTEEDVEDDLEHWLTYTQFTQPDADVDRVLTVGEYNLASQDDPSSQVEIIEEVSPLTPGETRREVVYYELINQESPVIFTALGAASVEIFEISIDELVKLAPQSGVYYNDSSTLAGYLFDFDKLYMVFTEEATLAQIHDVEGTANLVSEATLSPEAQSQFQVLQEETDAAHLQLLEFKDVYYELSDPVVGIRQIQVEDGEEILSNILMTLRGQPERLTLTNQDGDTYSNISQ